MFIDSLLSLLSELKRKSLPLIVGGDMNLNLLNPLNLGYIKSFINGMVELDLLPAINIPTKINVENPRTKYSILDQFWVSSSLLLFFIITSQTTNPNWQSMMLQTRRRQQGMKPSKEIGKIGKVIVI